MLYTSAGFKLSIRAGFWVFPMGVIYSRTHLFVSEIPWTLHNASNELHDVNAYGDQSLYFPNQEYLDVIELNNEITLNRKKALRVLVEWNLAKFPKN